MPNKTPGTPDATKMERVLRFVLRGLESGDIKCPPILTYDPKARTIPLRSLAGDVREALGGPKDEDDDA